MNKKSKKELETEQFVDECIEKTGYPPTYLQIQEKFNIGAAPSYYRCRNFRHKMKQNFMPAPGPQFVKIKIDGYVLNDDFEKFALLLCEMKKYFQPTMNTGLINRIRK